MLYVYVYFCESVVDVLCVCMHVCVCVCVYLCCVAIYNGGTTYCVPKYYFLIIINVLNFKWEQQYPIIHCLNILLVPVKPSEM